MLPDPLPLAARAVGARDWPPNESNLTLSTRGFSRLRREFSVLLRHWNFCNQVGVLAPEDSSVSNLHLRGLTIWRSSVSCFVCMRSTQACSRIRIPINDQSIHEELTCLFIVCETMFTIGDTQGLSMPQHWSKRKKFHHPTCQTPEMRKTASNCHPQILTNLFD